MWMPLLLNSSVLHLLRSIEIFFTCEIWHPYVARITVLHLSNINVILQLEQIFCQIQNFNYRQIIHPVPDFVGFEWGFKWKCSIFLTLAANKCPCVPVCGIISDNHTTSLWHPVDDCPPIGRWMGVICYVHCKYPTQCTHFFSPESMFTHLELKQ